VSGLPTDKFRFVGFLPAKPTQRQKVLETLKSVPDTLVFYEAPHRICAALNDALGAFGSERIAFMAREISKTFETYLYGTIEELLAQVSADSNQQRGEIVLVLAGNTVSNENLSADAEKIVKTLMRDLPITKAASLAAKITGDDKKQLYQLALTLQNKSP
jgi:16S rRNA (cytidine1402-2'-O)-methyltransferase